MAPPFREIEFDIQYGEGVSHEGLLIDLGVAAGVVDKAGAWLSYNGERVGQGRENAKVFLKENPDMAAQIEREVLEKNGVMRQVAERSPRVADDGEGVQAVAPPPAKKKSKGGRLRS